MHTIAVYANKLLTEPTATLDYITTLDYTLDIDTNNTNIVYLTFKPITARQLTMLRLMLSNSIA